ncbi:hypothetical protein LIA77_00807 [Sarocladium implicatum]|nr:hypothetical protein LIA77_00807 [Sarocladium implicatum]
MAPLGCCHGPASPVSTSASRRHPSPHAEMCSNPYIVSALRKGSSVDISFVSCQAMQVFTGGTAYNLRRRRENSRHGHARVWVAGATLPAAQPIHLCKHLSTAGYSWSDTSSHWILMIRSSPRNYEKRSEARGNSFELLRRISRQSPFLPGGCFGYTYSHLDVAPALAASWKPRSEASLASCTVPTLAHVDGSSDGGPVFLRDPTARQGSLTSTQITVLSRMKVDRSASASRQEISLVFTTGQGSKQ